MTAIAIDKTNWFMKMLAPLSRDIKLSIISRLSASLIEERKRHRAKDSFFDGLTGAWIDDVSPEAETERIRSSRVSGVTRNIQTF